MILRHCYSGSKTDGGRFGEEILRFIKKPTEPRVIGEVSCDHLNSPEEAEPRRRVGGAQLRKTGSY